MTAEEREIEEHLLALEVARLYYLLDEFDEQYVDIGGEGGEE